VNGKAKGSQVERAIRILEVAGLTTRPVDSNRCGFYRVTEAVALRIRSARTCYLCLRNNLLHMSPE
jgi:hypothetical protein